MKRNLWMLLILVILLGLLCCSAATAENSGTCGDNVTWTLDSNGLLTISGAGDMYDYTDFLSEVPPWLGIQPAVRSVIVESGVTSIGYSAFNLCSSLESVVIPDTVTVINNVAFWNCTNLVDVNIPDSVTRIGEMAFYNCDSLTAVHIPSSVASIERSAFSGSSLQSITVDEQNANYSSVDGVLYSKDATGIIICPDGKQGTFIVPDGVTSLAQEAFAGCSGLTEIILPDSIRSIGFSAFANCPGLTEMSIPEGVASITLWAFQNCSNLRTITIPASIKSINKYAFDGCTSLTDVNYGGTKAQWNNITIDDGNEPLLDAVLHPAGPEVVDSGTCGDNVTWTLDSDGLLAISGTGPMYNYITEIPENPPWRWNSGDITAIEIAEGVTTIGDYAFRFAAAMNEISIPVSVTSIGDYAFQGCYELGAINYAGSKGGWYDILVGSGNEYLTEAYLECAVATPDLPWTFSNGVLTISGTGAMPDYEAYEYEGERLAPWFEHRGDIQSVVIENGVTSIGEYAFYHYPALTSVTMADSVRRIEPDAFGQCPALASVHFSSGLTDIGSRAFIDCSALTSITLPASLKSIGFIAFANCGLTSITAAGSTATHHFFYAEETGEHLYHIDLPSAVVSVGEAAFYGNALVCDQPDFVLPADVTAIEAEAFSGISANYVWLPYDLTAIGSRAFADSAVSFVFIPDGCDNIAADAFPDSTILLVEMNYYFGPGSAEEYAIENGYDYVVLENPFGGNG